MFLGYTYFSGDIEAGGSASLIATPPEPGVVTTLVDWHRGDDRILISCEVWPEFDADPLGAEIIAAIRG